MNQVQRHARLAVFGQTVEVRATLAKLATEASRSWSEIVESQTTAHRLEVGVGRLDD